MRALRLWIVLWLGLALCPPLVPAQSEGLDRAAAGAEEKLAAATAQLAALREEIQAGQIPLTKRLGELETKLLDVRKEYDRVLRIRDGRNLDVSNMKAQIKSREDQSAYLANLLDEYFRNFETRLHIAELQRYDTEIKDARSAIENNNVSLTERFIAKLGMVNLSMDRLEEATGGVRFPGTAVDANGVVGEGTFILLGPLAYFAGEDDAHTGLAETKLNSLEPSVIPIPGASVAAIQEVARTGRGTLPVDVTRGSALKLAETKETLVEHVKKGGLTMIPILGLFFVAIIVGIIKWIQFSRVQRPSGRAIAKILNEMAEGSRRDAQAMAARIRGPIGHMLVEAIEHVDDPRELQEEVMYENVLNAKASLNRLLPIIAVTASAAPLLGLLGTVTGMINTFKMITVFGTGDAQTLSGGISEALITTEWGLIVAIPSLLLFAFLSRKSRGVTDDMEKLAVTFLNRLSRKRDKVEEDGEMETPASDEGENWKSGGSAPSAAPEPA